jgi:myosin heavy subunit
MFHLPTGAGAAGGEEIVWVRDEAAVWREAVCLKQGKSAASVRFEDGTVAEIAVGDMAHRNQPGYDCMDDLGKMQYLPEAAILHALHSRWSDRDIYSFAGPILIAVNPYQRFPQLYTREVLDRCDVPSRVPHAFSIGVCALDGIAMKANQSILVSGESGAGKTETTKFVLQALVHCSDGASNLQEKVWRRTLSWKPSGMQGRCRTTTPRVLASFCS